MAFHKLLEIFQKVSRKQSQKVSQTLLKKQTSKDAFCNESCSKVARKNKPFFGLMLKYANCTTKVSIFVQF